MKKLSTRSALLSVAAVVLWACVSPGTGLATSWGVVGSEHTLDSPNFGLSTTSNLGKVDMQCNSSFFTVDVSSAADLSVTSANFGGLCTSTINGGSQCNTTWLGTGLPWTITATATDNVQIDKVRIDVRLEQTLTDTCPPNFVDQSFTITGSLNGGVWNVLERAIVYTNTEGLRSHSPFGVNQPVTTRGTLRDTGGTLTLRD